jgi:hypothetical protein
MGPIPMVGGNGGSYFSPKANGKCKIEGNKSERWSCWMESTGFEKAVEEVKGSSIEMN